MEEVESEDGSSREELEEADGGLSLSYHSETEDDDDDEQVVQVLESNSHDGVTNESDKHITMSLTNQAMTTTSQHSFGKFSQNSDAFSITVIENMKEEYGLFVWPCSIILAEYIWQQRSRFPGNSVVELGAGTSLPGLVAAKLGSDVTLTDDSNRLEVLANMSRVCDINNLQCNVLGLTWGMWDASIFKLQPKIILGADVLYDSIAFDDLFATLTFLLQNSPGSIFITTYHNRSGHHLIEFLMEKWGLKCVKLLDGFSFMPSSKASGLIGNIQLAEIVLNSEQTDDL